MPLKLTCLGTAPGPNGRTVHFIKAPFAMDRDKPEIAGFEVDIDGKVGRVTGVERHPVGRPIREGEEIGLLLDH